MHAVISLLILCGTMFAGSFLAGLIPLTLSNVHSRHIKWFAAFGAGMLLATSTDIIIPEAFSCETRQSGLEPQTDKSTGVKENSRWYYGATFTLGFLFMFTIDNAAKMMSLSRFRNQWITTLGLCIHAVADGLVVAVAALDDDHIFRYIVFFVMAIHKAPAAFGLVSFLMKQDGILVHVIKRHLLVFSLSSPTTALLSYFLLKYASGVGHTLLGTKLPMLFSAGTFVYISTTHVIPELHDGEDSMSTGLSAGRLMCFLSGCIIPFVVSFIHVHH